MKNSKRNKIIFIIGLIIAIATVFIPVSGCQTVKDNWDHQFNDEREDDLSGEWFREAPEDTASTFYSVNVIISVTTDRGLDSSIVDKTVTLDSCKEMKTQFTNELLKEIKVNINLRWQSAVATDKIFVSINNWEYFVNLSQKESGSQQVTAFVEPNKKYELKFGVKNL